MLLVLSVTIYSSSLRQQLFAVTAVIDKKCRYIRD
jgi:hypothetical protein